MLSDKSGEPFLKKGDWNRYEIEAIGKSPAHSHLRSGSQLCADYRRRGWCCDGVFTFSSCTAGGPTEVRFRNIKLEVKNRATGGQLRSRQTTYYGPTRQDRSNSSAERFHIVAAATCGQGERGQFQL